MPWGSCQFLDSFKEYDSKTVLERYTRELKSAIIIKYRAEVKVYTIEVLMEDLNNLFYYHFFRYS